VERAEIIEPSTEHVITFQIDPNDSSLRKNSVPIQPTIVLPAANVASPSVDVFRLELLYAFENKSQQHSATDWNITFTVFIKTTRGLTIPLFREAKWR